jgi:hypothetical protein
MRIVLGILLAPFCCAALLCFPLRADYSYQRRIQITAGELYDALRALGPRTPGSRDAVAAASVTTTNLIKGNRMALIAKGHTIVIDIAAETITDIEFSRKTYSVLPFAQMKKLLEDAAARAPRETGFEVSVQRPGQTKIVGILNASETIVAIAGASGSENITVDSWIGTVPGYEQMIDFNRRLADKMGYAFGSGLAQLALSAPQTLQGFGEAAKELNKAPGAPLQTTIKITGSGGTLAEASIHLDDFGGGIQDVTRFDPPAGFKKMDAVLPALPK